MLVGWWGDHSVEYLVVMLGLQLDVLTGSDLVENWAVLKDISLVAKTTARLETQLVDQLATQSVPQSALKSVPQTVQQLAVQLAAYLVLKKGESMAEMLAV